jgi:hypothetical protein
MSAQNRQQAIINEASRLVIELNYSPASAILTACETVDNTSPQSRRVAIILWAIMVKRIRNSTAPKSA